MEDLYLDQHISLEQAKAYIQAMLPGCAVFSWDCATNEILPTDFSTDVANTVVVEVVSVNSHDFPCRLTVYQTPNKHEESRALWFARTISRKGNCSVMVPFSYPNAPDDPYYCIVFKGGASYLGDDSEADLTETNIRPIRIIGPYSLPTLKFDAFGGYISCS